MIIDILNINFRKVDYIVKIVQNFRNKKYRILIFNNNLINIVIIYIKLEIISRLNYKENKSSSYYF